jgi:hypothetical protein
MSQIIRAAAVTFGPGARTEPAQHLEADRVYRKGIPMANRTTLITKVGAVGVVAALIQRKRRNDPVHAPGHRHRKPPPTEGAPPTVDGPQPQNQPWIRRSHSDSQKRRFRR